MSAMTNLDAKALEAAKECLAAKWFDPEVNDGPPPDVFDQEVRETIEAYLDALPPAQSAGQIDRIEAKLDRVERKISSMSGLISNWVRARS